MKKDIFSADHPARQLAIKVVEQIIEPEFALDDGIEGEQYYKLEDELTLMFASHIKTF